MSARGDRRNQEVTSRRARDAEAWSKRPRASRLAVCISTFFSRTPLDHAISKGPFVAGIIGQAVASLKNQVPRRPTWEDATRLREGGSHACEACCREGRDRTDGWDGMVTGFTVTAGRGGCLAGSGARREILSSDLEANSVAVRIPGKEMKCPHVPTSVRQSTPWSLV